MHVCACTSFPGLLMWWRWGRGAPSSRGCWRSSERWRWEDPAPPAARNTSQSLFNNVNSQMSANVWSHVGGKIWNFFVFYFRVAICHNFSLNHSKSYQQDVQKQRRHYIWDSKPLIGHNNIFIKLYCSWPRKPAASLRAQISWGLELMIHL